MYVMISGQARHVICFLASVILDVAQGVLDLTIRNVMNVFSMQLALEGVVYAKNFGIQLQHVTSGAALVNRLVIVALVLAGMNALNVVLTLFVLQKVFAHVFLTGTTTLDARNTKVSVHLFAKTRNVMVLK